MEKGKGSAGTFTFLGYDEPAGLPTADEQVAAIQNPVAYDEDTDSLLKLVIEEQGKRR